MLGIETMNRLSNQQQTLAFETLSPHWEKNGIVFPFVRGTPLDQKRVYNDFKLVLKGAGLPAIRFNNLRHTPATLMLMNGIPLIVVSRRLGHIKPSVTLSIYRIYLPGMYEKAVDFMEELVTQIAPKWQQGGNSYEPTIIENSEKHHFQVNKAEKPLHTGAFPAHPEGKVTRTLFHLA